MTQIDFRTIGGIIGGLLLAAVRSFLFTLLGLLLLGVILAGCSFWILTGTHLVYAIVAAVVALLECLVAGVILGVKRAPVMALVHGQLRVLDDFEAIPPCEDVR